MRASVNAVFRNIPAMILWSGLILVLTIIGFAPLLVGLVIIVPLLGHATWCAYLGMIRPSPSFVRANIPYKDSPKGFRRDADDSSNPNDVREGHLTKVRKLTPLLR